MKYYIGVDGGGTKTAIAAADQNASRLILGSAGSASWREYGIPHVINEIKQAVFSLPFSKRYSIGGIALGIPCVAESIEGDRALEDEIKKAFPGIAVYLANDVEVGWAGSLGLSPGVNVVAGTGSIAFGKNKAGQAARCGGWSEFYGDEGSCYWLGRKLMEIFSKQSDGRMERDALYEAVRSHFSLANDFEFIDIMCNEYVTQRDKTASLQMLLKDAARTGSPSAKQAYSAAVLEIASLVTAISKKLAFEEVPFLVSYSGGLFKAGDLVLPQLAAEVEKIGGELTPPLYEPATGALLLAFSEFSKEKLPGVHELLKR